MSTHSALVYWMASLFLSNRLSRVLFAGNDVYVRNVLAHCDDVRIWSIHWCSSSTSSPFATIAEINLFSMRSYLLIVWRKMPSRILWNCANLLNSIHLLIYLLLWAPCTGIVNTFKYLLLYIWLACDELRWCWLAYKLLFLFFVSHCAIAKK